jgi:hypothetical protein
MKLCLFHMASLRSALEKHGLYSQEALFQAVALTNANAAETNFAFVSEAPADACPYCKGIIPHNWTDKVAASIAKERAEEKDIYRG